MQQLPPVLEERLKQWDRQGRLRTLSLGAGIDFSSNDYLGFARDPVLRERLVGTILSSGVPFGSTGSRLLRGHSALFDEAESVLAQFCSQEAALIYPSGFQANLGLLSALLAEGDLVFSDARNHASLIDGIRLSRARKCIYSTLDQLEEQLQEFASDPSFKLIVTESLFGMDGVKASLLELSKLAERYGAYLVVDEAHATGIWGQFERLRGGGWAQSLGISSRLLATLHTGGKALGLGGAWVACSHALKHYLVNASRPMIFSTAPMPLLPLSLLVTLQYWQSGVGPQRADLLLKKAQSLGQRLRVNVQDSPILPLHIGENQRSLEVAQKMQHRGFDVRAIRPPTVPQGTARLRVCVHAHHTEQDLERFAGAFAEALA